MNPTTQPYSSETKGATTTTSNTNITNTSETTINKLFRWRPSRETLAALGAGAIVLGLSAAAMPFDTWPWIRIGIRDFGQIFVAGILFPLIYILRSGGGFGEFGLSLRKWWVFLPIDTVLAVLLLINFMSESPPPPDFRLDSSNLWAAAYVMLALCFELIFFYAFLRTLLERAFGTVPAIFLTALFYSFHHLGFQPEYGKLFFVGLLYAITYRLGNSTLLIFPFFLGVGGTYDVLIQSQAVSPVLYPEIRTAYLAVAFAGTAVWIWKRRGPTSGSVET